MESLSSKELNNIKRVRSDTIFKIGNVKACRTIERITIPVVIAEQNLILTTEVIEDVIPLLLSRDTIKKANTFILRRFRK